VVAHTAHIVMVVDMGIAVLPLDTHLGVPYTLVDTALGMAAGMVVDTALGMVVDTATGTVAADILPCPLMLRQIAMP
jgi:hypothetical protein